MLGKMDRRGIAVGFELAEMIDVPAEAVNEIESIVQHLGPPDSAEALYHLSTGAESPALAGSGSRAFGFGAVTKAQTSDFPD
jgi:hypothetical protein